MLRTRRWRLAAAWLAALGALSAPARGQAPPAPPPPARTEAELASARQLFAESLRAEQEGRFEVALDGFRRVREVRDTAPVEYRIAMCLEGLGRFAEALATHDAAVHASEGDAAAGAEIAAASRARIDALSKRVAHLQLTLSPRSPTDAEIRVDGKPQRGGDVVLDPGHHRVEATATGAASFRSDVELPPGARLALTVPLDPVPVAPPPAADEAPPTAPPRPPTSAPASTATWGWISVGAGGVLVAAAVTSLVLRESDIRTANRDCPGGGCVGSINGEAQSATDRARAEGPLAVGLGAAGVVAAGVGVYLVVRSPGPGTLSLSPAALRDGGGLVLRGAM